MTEPVHSDTPAIPAPPSTPAEASARLDALRTDPKWADALLRGGPTEAKEFHALHELAAKGDNIDMAIGGVLQPGMIQSSEHLQNINAAEMLRDIGMPVDVVKEALSGKTAVPREFYDKIANWKKDAMTDADWSGRLLSGDRKARAQLSLANIILSGAIKESAA